MFYNSACPKLNSLLWLFVSGKGRGCEFGLILPSGPLEALADTKTRDEEDWADFHVIFA